MPPTVLASLLAVSLVFTLFLLRRQPDRPFHSTYSTRPRRSGSSRGWFDDSRLLPDPFEYKPIPRDPKARILFFADYEGGLDTYYYETYEAARRHPSIEITDFWGPGFAGYNSSIDWNENLNRRYGCGHFDFVFTHGLARIWDTQQEFAATFGCGTLLITTAPDCNVGQCAKDTYWLHGNITLSRYAHELHEMYSPETLVKVRDERYHPFGLKGPFQFQLFGHTPDAANEWDFYPVTSWAEKKHDVVMFGKAWGGFYPLRHTVEQAIDKGETMIKRHALITAPNITDEMVKQHLSNPPASLDWHAPVHAGQRAVLRDFAKAMREAKICVFDGSVEEKAIRKYAQAMLSGCVIAADLPTDHDWALKGNMIELDLYASISEINAAIVAALRDEREMQRKAARMLSYARHTLTYTRVLDVVLELEERYRNGERGYAWPTGFTARCRRYDLLDVSPVTPWCTGKDWVVPGDWSLDAAPKGY